MTVLHSEDADRCVYATTTEQAGRTERGSRHVAGILGNDISKLNMP